MKQTPTTNTYEVEATEGRHSMETKGIIPSFKAYSLHMPPQ
jgi:hypothetical protein